MEPHETQSERRVQAAGPARVHVAQSARAWRGWPQGQQLMVQQQHWGVLESSTVAANVNHVGTKLMLRPIQTRPEMVQVLVQAAQEWSQTPDAWS